MGIAYGALRFLMEEGRQKPWQGKVLTLGRQDTGFSAASLAQAASENAFTLGDDGKPELAVKSDASALRYVSDTWFFRALGFDSVTVLDASDYEDADIIHDLNSPFIPRGYSGQYDLVLDGGTLEHVFDVPNALRSMCEMAKIGGRIIHISPMSNCVDHGFYSFSPTLFADFYAANGFEIRRLVLVRFDRDPGSDPWEYMEYKPGVVGTLGQLPPGTYFLMVCVMRLPGSRWDLIPQQAHYQNVAWPQSTQSQE